MVGGVKKMFADNSAQLAKLTKKVEVVRNELGLEIGQIRLDLDKGNARRKWYPRKIFRPQQSRIRKGEPSSPPLKRTKR